MAVGLMINRGCCLCLLLLAGCISTKPTIISAAAGALVLRKHRLG